jgi:hypothetical protein
MWSGTKNRKVVRAGPGPTRRTTHTVCGFYGYVTFVGFTCQMGRAPAGVSMRRARFVILGFMRPAHDRVELAGGHILTVNQGCSFFELRNDMPKGH